MSEISGPLINCPDQLCGDDVDATGGVCLIEVEDDYDDALSEIVNSCKDIGGVVAVIYDNEYWGESTFWGYLDEETRIPSIGISNPNGLLLLANTIGSTARLCDISCSDLLPPCPEGRYFDFDYETRGYCYECEDGCDWASTLKGGQECIYLWKTLFAQTQFLVPVGVSATSTILRLMAFVKNARITGMGLPTIVTSRENFHSRVQTIVHPPVEASSIFQTASFVPTVLTLRNF